jgi:putative transposase
MDETYIKITGQWNYHYRAVYKERPDYRLSVPHRDKPAALLFLESRLAAGLPDNVTIDKSGANRAALEALKEETGQEIEIRQIRYLNNRVEQEHWAQTNGSTHARF